MPNRTRSKIISRSRLASLTLLASIVAVVASGGCTSVGHEIIPTGVPTTLGPVPGDRDDVARALLIALESAEAVLLEGRWRGETYTASFLMVESRQGRATATLGADGGLMLSAFVEPAGDEIAQRTLLDAWARRLEQLHGVAWAPR